MMGNSRIRSKVVKSKEEVERQLILHYIDKTHQTYLEIWRSFNRTAIFQILLSLLVIALSTGLISVTQEISITGHKLESSYWLVLFVSLWILGCCFAYLIALTIHGEYLEAIIFRLYKKIGFEDETLNRKLHPLAPPDIFNLMTLHFDSKVFEVIMLLLLAAVTLLIPIAAEIMAGYRLIVILGVKWWLIGTYIVLLFLHVWFLIVGFKNA